MTAMLLTLAILAQAIGGMSGIGRGGGSGGGTPAVVCTNQLVLIYSNSCALIGQGFGQ